MPYFDFYASEHAGAPEVADGSVLTSQAVHDSWRWVVQARCSTADARIFALNILVRPGTTAVRAFSSKRRGSTLGRLAFAVTIPPAPERKPA